MNTGHVVVEIYPGYSKHIRQLAEGEEPKPSGLSSKPQTLCGRIVQDGWDMKIPLPKTLEEWEADPAFHRNCSECASKYLATRG